MYPDRVCRTHPLRFAADDQVCSVCTNCHHSNCYCLHYVLPPQLVDGHRRSRQAIRNDDLVVRVDEMTD